MTCKEAADLIYTFAEPKPPSEAQKQFQVHIRKCPECIKFIRGLGKKAETQFDVSCGEIPDALLEEFSHLIKANLGRTS